MEGGKKREREGREGLPSDRGWEPVGPREAARAPQAAPEKALITAVSLERKERGSETSGGNGVEALFYLLRELLRLPDGIKVTEWSSFPEESLQKARGAEGERRRELGLAGEVLAARG